MLFQRVAIALFIGLFSLSLQASSSQQTLPHENIADEPDNLAETVFELERSLAILQLSTARLSDYQSLAEHVAENRSLQDKVNFLICFVFIMLVALLVVAYQLRNTQKALNKLKVSTEGDS
ncbi:hypothetical protein [Marinomonas sp.]